jgi:hypothetical protein
MSYILLTLVTEMPVLILDASFALSGLFHYKHYLFNLRSFRVAGERDVWYILWPSLELNSL